MRERFCVIQANTSPLSPEDLDQSMELRCSDSITLAEEVGKLRELISLKIIGGYCGIDHTHMGQMAKRCSSLAI